MSPLRFVHAADLHLDSPFKGLRAVAPEHVADVLHDATFRAYENIIELCIAEKVDALLVAGDIYDSGDRSLRAQRKFIDGLNRLHDAGIRSFVCHGNHDPLDGWEARLEYPPTCHRFGSEFEAIPVFEADPGRAIVHGISYPRRDITENLVGRLGSIDQGPFSIGLLHTNVGNIPGHDLYAPCSLDDLCRTGIDYWALGHIHTRQVLHDREPTVVYPGNPQGRHVNETGARGVYLVEVQDSGRVDPRFIAVDSIRWEQLEVDIGEMTTEQALLDALHDSVERTQSNANGRSVIARVTLVGRGVVNRFLRRPGVVDDILEQLNEVWAVTWPFAWCERIEDRTNSPFKRQARLAGTDFLSEVLRTADQAREDPERLERLCSGIGELYGHYRYRRQLTAPDNDELAALVSEAEMMVVNLLAEDEA